MRTNTCTGRALLALRPGAQPAAEGKLSIYHWFEYIPQELLVKFTEETGIEVTMDTYDSNESMLASLKGGTLGSYDVAVPGDYMVQIMRDEGMLDTIAEGELANNKGQHRSRSGSTSTSTRAGCTRSPTSGARPASWSTARSMTARSTPPTSSSTRPRR